MIFDYIFEVRTSHGVQIQRQIQRQIQMQIRRQIQMQIRMQIQNQIRRQIRKQLHIISQLPRVDIACVRVSERRRTQ